MSMSAETRREVPQYMIMRLLRLVGDVVLVIGKGLRSESMLDTLLNALELFKENRLQSVTPIATQSDAESTSAEKEEESNDPVEVRCKSLNSWAFERVKMCIEDPAGSATIFCDPMTLAAAQWVFSSQSAHQCYWNNRFCVAVMCKLPWSDQELAAWCLVSNGLNGYWEWTTHSGYDMAAVLKHIGILDEEFELPPRVNDQSYCSAPFEILQKIAERFKLPTSRFDDRRPTVYQQKTAAYYNARYRYQDVL